jgi:hypothetical protein
MLSLSLSPGVGAALRIRKSRGGIETMRGGTTANRVSTAMTHSFVGKGSRTAPLEIHRGNHAGTPGKRTLTEGLAPVQRKVGATTATGQAAGHDETAVHSAAARGVATPTAPLPHLDTIQRAFGRHDISGIQAHVGGDAAASAREMGAKAYAAGDHVVLGEDVDLHTVAHEAAHVIQQRGGVQLKGTVGEVGDAYELQADEVADRVVRREKAEELLDTVSGGSGGGNREPDVQRIAAGQPAGIAGAPWPSGPVSSTVVQRTIDPSTTYNTLVRVSDQESPHFDRVGRVQRVSHVDSTATVFLGDDASPTFRLTQLDYELVPPGKDDKREAADEEQKRDRGSEKEAKREESKEKEKEKEEEREDSEDSEEESDKEFDQDEAQELVDEMNKIHAALNSALGPSKWAFTGSFALYLWSQFYHVGFHRKPDDYDVVVPGTLISNAMWALRALEYVGELPLDYNPAARYRMTKPSFKVDVMRSGVFASLDDVTSLGQYRVTTLEQMNAKKQRIVNDVWRRPADVKKAKADLNQLKAVNDAVHPHRPPPRRPPDVRIGWPDVRIGVSLPPKKRPFTG